MDKPEWSKETFVIAKPTRQTHIAKTPRPYHTNHMHNISSMTQLANSHRVTYSWPLQHAYITRTTYKEHRKLHSLEGFSYARSSHIHSRPPPFPSHLRPRYPTDITRNDIYTDYYKDQPTPPLSSIHTILSADATVATTTIAGHK
jgi:hypothetical protein